MKMMKTEMEFVTFDAQDVITTSGGLFLMVNGREITDRYSLGYNGQYITNGMFTDDSGNPVYYKLTRIGNSGVWTNEAAARATVYQDSNAYYLIDPEQSSYVYGDPQGTPYLWFTGEKMADASNATASTMDDVVKWLYENKFVQ